MGIGAVAVGTAAARAYNYNSNYGYAPYYGDTSYAYEQPYAYQQPYARLSAALRVEPPLPKLDTVLIGRDLVRSNGPLTSLPGGPAIR